MEMTVTRALAELKLLDKKIERGVENCTQLQGIVQGNSVVQGAASNEEAKKNAEAALQSVQDLIKQRKKIKDAVVLSNATTEVKISGINMTVAEAIERKNSIQYDKDLFQAVRNRKVTVEAELRRRNEQARQEFDKRAEAILQGKDNTSAEYKSLFDAYMAENEWKVVGADVEKFLEKKQKEIDDFELEVDFVLSESNTTTKIEV